MLTRWAMSIPRNQILRAGALGCASRPCSSMERSARFREACGCVVLRRVLVIRFRSLTRSGPSQVAWCGSRIRCCTLQFVNRDLGAKRMIDTLVGSPFGGCSHSIGVRRERNNLEVACPQVIAKHLPLVLVGINEQDFDCCVSEAVAPFHAFAVHISAPGVDDAPRQSLAVNGESDVSVLVRGRNVRSSSHA